MGQRQAEIGAEIGKFFLGVLADHLAFFEARLDGGEQLRGGEGLGQIIVGAEVHPASHAVGIVHAGHENERDGSGDRLLAQSFEQSIAVHPLHVDVANDQVRQEPPGQVSALRAIAGLHGFKAPPLQRAGGGLAEHRFIINDEDLLHVSG